MEMAAENIACVRKKHYDDRVGEKQGSDILLSSEYPFFYPFCEKDQHEYKEHEMPV